MDMMVVFDVVLIAYGIYTVYSAVSMKKTGIPGDWLMGSSELSQCRDLKGFVEYMYMKTIAFGILAFFYGVMGVVNDLLLKLGIFNMIGIAVFLAGCIVYVVLLNKAKKKFL